MEKILSKVEKATMMVAVSEQEKQEFYSKVKQEIPMFESKLNKWNPRGFEKKKLKGLLQQTLESLKKTGGKSYSEDKLKFEYINNNL